MGSKQFENIKSSTSPYRQLHGAIVHMMNHGNAVRDDSVIVLAEQLRDALGRFEGDPNHQDMSVKHRFKDIFLRLLHSKDPDFSENRNMRDRIHEIHKTLYATVFLNQEHLRRFSLFTEKQEEAPPFQHPHPKKSC